MRQMNVATSLCLVICALTSVARAGQPISALISGPRAEGVSASGHSSTPLLSADRRYLVFLSSAKNLVAGDTLAPHLDVFRHDLVTGETKLISTAANADSSSASVSSNGQWIAFASAANNLLPASDNNSGVDIFLADADTLERSLITATPEANTPANRVLGRNLSLSDKPQISANGRWIAFESFATNLTADADSNNESDVFLRDAVTAQTVLVSVAFESGTTAKGKSEIVGITPDGNYILFASTATNLIANNLTNGYQELYIRDVAAGTTTWVLHTNTIPPDTSLPAPPPPPGNLGPYNCRWALMSSNAEFVLYKVEFPSKTNARVHLYDRQNGSNIVLTTRSRVGSAVHISSNGRFVAYDETNHVFLWDRETGTRTQVSLDPNSHSPGVSDDGRIVAFVNGVPRMPSQIFYRNTVNGDLRRLTETLSGGPSAKDHSGSSIIVDPSGEFILFDSIEHDLVSDDRNRASDIFLHQIATGETRLISEAHPSSPAFTASGRAGITNFCVSADGNRILFFSTDSDLVPGDTNGWPDAFLREVSTGRTSPLTTNENGMFSGTNSVAHGLLSANGRYALLGMLSPFRYEWGSGLAPASVVRKDLETGQTVTLLSNVSTALGPYPPVVPFFGFSISVEGRRVAYPWNDDIIVTDLETSVQTNVTPGGDFWSEPMISPDGHYVTYVHVSSGQLFISELSTGQRSTISSSYLRGVAFSQNSQFVVYSIPSGPSSIYVYSISDRSNAFVCANCINPSLSTDARFVVYESGASGTRQIELKDRLTARTWAVTRNINGTGGGNIDAIWPVISTDGRFVAFTSKATNLTTDLPNGWNNLYVYDRLQGTTVRITGTRSNTGYGSSSASRPILAANGRTLVFQSFASDFVENDFNDTRDIFLLTLGGEDTDNDGMSDAWEQTHFSTTDRDGTGDFDQDGQTDLAEYLAGTNPNNNQSILEVLQITSVSSGQRQLIWRTEPGKSYRLEYKPDLAGATWTSLGHVITATQPTASALDTTAAAEKRFYRVALVQ